ncbi:NmrA-like domain containing protein [Candidatus Pelagibacterales bacterium]
MSIRKVAVAGGSGALGNLIVQELVNLGAEVIVLRRKGSLSSRSFSISVKDCEVNYESVDELAKALNGIEIVVCCLAGLKSVIVDTQERLMQAAVKAGVSKFIPSDFAIDFRTIPYGENRNLNLRREFFERFEHTPIKKTSILNGAFTDMLTGVAPFILFKFKKILCWGSPNQKMDWTTMADTARYTAFATLDRESPRFLKIAGDQISAEDLSEIMFSLTGVPHKIFKPSGLYLFKKLISITKFFVPGGKEIYPPWQGMQYMHNMYSGIAKFSQVDNERYPVQFTIAKDILKKYLQIKKPV